MLMSHEFIMEKKETLCILVVVALEKCLLAQELALERGERETISLVDKGERKR
jgi:hypothetical protein